MSLMMLVLLISLSCLLILIALLIFRATLRNPHKMAVSFTAIERTSVDELLREVRKIDRAESVIKKVAITFCMLLLIVGIVWLRRSFYGPVMLF
jgi:hypothetical protein